MKQKNQSKNTPVRVIEYCPETVSAAYCGKLLANMGFEVIKVEEPLKGDKARNVGPFKNDIPEKEGSGLFLYLNINKLGITLNINDPDGLNILKRLLKDADIFLWGGAFSEAKEYGLDYSSLCKINDRLIVTSTTPFGHSGPYRDFKATDFTTFQMSSLGYENPPEVTNLKNEPPLKAPGRQTEIVSGIAAGTATLAALHQRRTTGKGQEVEVSRWEAFSSLAAMGLTQYAYEKKPYPRSKTRLAGLVAVVPCQDGYACIQAIQPHHWQNLMNIMDNPEWSKDDRFKDAVTRKQHWEAVKKHLTEWTLTRTRHEVVTAAQNAGIPVLPVNTTADLVNSEQLKERQFFIKVDHPVAGLLRYPGPPFKQSVQARTTPTAAPLLGEHNRLILSDQLGISQEKLVNLKERGII